MTLGHFIFAANIVFESPISPKTLIDVKHIYIYLYISLKITMSQCHCWLLWRVQIKMYRLSTITTPILDRGLDCCCGHNILIPVIQGVADNLVPTLVKVWSAIPS